MIEVPTTQGVPVLAAVTFTVGGPIVGLNAAYKPGIRGKGDGAHATIVLTAAGQEYKDRIKAHAALALAQSRTWPKDPWRPLHVRVSLFMFNSKHDAGAATKVVCDSLEGIFYANDRIVSLGEQPRPENGDDRGTRLVVHVELLEVDTQAGADARRQVSSEAAATRAKRKTRRGESAGVSPYSGGLMKAVARPSFEPRAVAPSGSAPSVFGASRRSRRTT